MGLRLALETTVARAIGALSRAVGAAAARRCRGRCSGSWIQAPSMHSAARLPEGVVVISATNGKTTTTAMTAEILGDGRRLAWNRAGANLLSGIASALVAGRRATLGLFEVDEGALSEAVERTRPRVVALGNLFRDQLDRYGELELVAERWRAAVAGLPAATTLVVNADDAVVADLADGRAGALRFGLDDPRHARTLLPHAADSKYCVRCGHPYEFAAAYVGHLGDYRCPSCGHHRPELDIAVRDIELRGLQASRFRLVTADGDIEVRAGPPGLYNVYNAAAAAASRTRRWRAPSTMSATGSSDSARRSGASSGSRPAASPSSCSSCKNPAGANEVVRTLETGVPPVLVDRTQRCDRGRPGRLVDLGRGLRAAPRARRARRSQAGERSAELGLRMVYGGLAEDRLEVIPSLEQALDRGLGLLEAGTELVVLPTYTAMLALRGHPDRARCGATVLGGATRVRIRVGHLYPDYLNIYADRGNIAVLERRARAARTRASTCGRSVLGDAARARSATTCSTSAAARIASRRSSRPIWLPRATRSGQRTSGASRCSPSAAATSSSGVAIADATGRSCRVRRSFRTRPSPVRRG